MHIKIERIALLKALDHVRSVVASRGTIPILNNVKITAAMFEPTITLTATDLDIECVGRAAAQIDGEGAITVGASTLYDIVRKLPDGGEIALKYNGEDPRLVVQCGRSRFQLPVLPAGDFPEMSADGLTDGADVDSAALARLIDRVAFAMSTEETRYYLNGIYLHPFNSAGGTVLRAVATDGHRLALADMPLPAGLEAMPGIIVPRKTIKELRRLLDAQTTVKLRCSPTKIRIEGMSVITSKLVDGAFPDYQRVVPRDNGVIASINADELAGAVDRVATISGEKARSARFAFSSGRLDITVRNMEAGQAVEEMDVEYNGQPFEIGFNARYVLDVMSRIDGNIAEFRMADSMSPCLVIDPNDTAAQFVVMPLRV